MLIGMTIGAVRAVKLPNGLLAYFALLTSGFLVPEILSRNKDREVFTDLLAGLVQY